MGRRRSLNQTGGREVKRSQHEMFSSERKTLRRPHVVVFAVILGLAIEHGF